MFTSFFNLFKSKTNNEPLSFITHFFGLLLSIAGLILLVIYAVRYGGAWHIVGFSIFGTSLILLYLASSLYHLAPITHKTKDIFRRIDHSMIYILIAGTYTPICFLFPQRGWGWSLFGIIWGLALLGIIIKASGKLLHSWWSLVLYILMGWLAVIAFIPLTKFIPALSLYWLFAGGIFYTLGVVFFSLDKKIKFKSKWYSMHAIFHFFVLAGSFCHFWLMFKYLLYLQ